MGGITLHAAHWWGVVCSFAVWGLYSGLILGTLVIIWFKCRGQLRKPAVGAMLVVYAINLMMVVCNIIRVQQAFLEYKDGPLMYYARHRDDIKIGLVQDLVDVLTTVIGDIVIAWRLYVIWGSDWRVLILPAVSLTIALGGSIASLVWDGLASRTLDFKPYATQYHDTTLVLYSQTIAYNWIITGLIVWKLWKVHRQNNAIDTASTEESPYVRIIVVLIESGGLYSLALLAFAITYGYGTGIYAIVISPSLPFIIGIVPVLIVLNAALGFATPSRPGSRTRTWKLTIQFHRATTQFTTNHGLETTETRRSEIEP